MAGTATNKQPLLMDRPLHVVRQLSQTSSPSGSVDPGSGSNGILLVDCVANQGAVLSEIYLVQRVGGDTTRVNLYVSGSNTFLGIAPSGLSVEAWYVGSVQFAAGPDSGAITTFTAPRILGPVPHAGANVDGLPPQFRGFPIEKGTALWAAVANPTPVANAPNIGVVGGYY